LVIENSGRHNGTNDTRLKEVRMKINSESKIHHPIDLVYRCYRDHLPEVAPYTEDVKEIIVKSREELPNGPKVHNVWVADRELPKMAQGIIKPEMMQWDDFAQWDNTNQHVDWRINFPTFPNQVQCSGRNTFIADGPDTTRVLLTGELVINLKNIPGVPRLLAGRIAPKVESFIVMLITPNLEKVNHSLERYLDEHGSEFA
jgi:hypothetical protein